MRHPLRTQLPYTTTTYCVCWLYAIPKMQTCVPRNMVLWDPTRASDIKYIRYTNVDVDVDAGGALVFVINVHKFRNLYALALYVCLCLTLKAWRMLSISFRVEHIIVHIVLWLRKFRGSSHCCCLGKMNDDNDGNCTFRTVCNKHDWSKVATFATYAPKVPHMNYDCYTSSKFARRLSTLRCAAIDPPNLQFVCK